MAFTEPSRTKRNGNSLTCPAAGQVDGVAKNERVQYDLSPHARIFERALQKSVVHTTCQTSFEMSAHWLSP